MEITAHCNENTIKQVVFLTKLLLTEESLEELCGNGNDDIIIEVAKEKNLRWLEKLREEEEDISYEVKTGAEADKHGNSRNDFDILKKFSLVSFRISD